MREQSVMLIDMPWSMPNRPSIQLGILRSVLRQAGIRSEVRSFHLAFMDYLASAHDNQPREVSFSFDDYVEVAENCWKEGLGDWIFAVPPFRDPGDWDERYLEYFRSDGKAEIATKALQIRRLVPAFLENCVAEVLKTASAVVGFTTTFNQNVPSLVLAKILKSRDPSVQIVFGGANCDGPMGDALHRAFPWVDVVVRGEAERVFPELVRDLFAGKTIRPQPGLCIRSGEERVVSEQEGGAAVPIDEVPTPDYDEYFERLAQSPSRAVLLPQLSVPFESARGCWWGAIKHCTFCGLNGSSMAFRSKSPDLVVETLMSLARSYGRLEFDAVDNIIDMQYFNSLLPKLRDTGYDFKLFYETKANLKKDQMRAMREAGVVTIQPGIESLSTPILRLMDKGVTAMQNIRLLKWCAEFGIYPVWNLMYGFPNEPAGEYDRMADVTRSLTHFPPPGNVVRVHLERFSPYYNQPREHGLSITGPSPYYSLIYPLDRATLNDLAYQFEYSYDDGRDPQTYTAAIKESIETWKRDYDEGSNLSYRRGPGFLLIDDRRPGLGGHNYSLSETESKIYLACDSGANASSVWEALLADNVKDIEREDVEDFLDEMTVQRLMYEEGGVYLSLAIPAIRRGTA